MMFRFLTLLSAVTAVLAADWLGETRTENGQTYQCKCYSDNACWPTGAQWSTLNTTVGGKLLVALPPAAPCHAFMGNISTYNAAKCAEVNANWENEQWLTDQTVAELWPFSTNNTCLPTNNPNDTCTRGYYPEYVIMATTKEHIKAGVNFARDHNLRLIIRNTGHDFMGRSTGYGSLAINTHSFKNVNFVKNYTGPGNYTGSAVTVGAGIQGRELYRQAFAQSPPVVIVGGECPTVGYSGGYLQGGGHGPLATIYGMGADSALSFDLVTAAGEYVTANAKENPDLFWALKGGGPATWGVVYSVTVKTHPEIPTAGVILNINSTHTNDSTLFWNGVRAFHNLSNHWTDNGMFVYFELQAGRFHVQPFVGPNMNASKIIQVTKPLFDSLDAQKIPYSKVVKDFPTFFELYIDLFEDETPNQQSLVGGRVLTRQDIAEHNDDIIEAFKTGVQPSASNPGFSVGHIVGPGVGVPVVDNAIHPGWRNASSFVINNVIVNGTESLGVKRQEQNLLNNVTQKSLIAAAPNGFAYVNEGNLEEPNWQQAYWGDHYPRLLSIQKTWDPSKLFYARTLVGTEDWEVIDYGKKLCKKV